MRTIIVAMLLMLYGSSLVWADGFGYDGMATLAAALENRIWSIRSSPASSGALDSVKIYLKVTTQAHLVKLAVYKWSDTSFVDSTYIIDVPVSESWVYFQFVNNASITADTEYAIAAWGEATAGDVTTLFNFTGGSCAAQSTAAYGVWPTPKWTTVDLDEIYLSSIYAYYTPEEVEGAGQVIIIQ